MLAFMILAGPTRFIFDSFIENIGNYAGNLITLGLWNEAYVDTDWQSSWTIFYWAWWVVGRHLWGFLLRAFLRGHTIRELFIWGAVCADATFILWFTTFGGVAVHMEMLGSYGFVEAVQADYGSAIFRFIEHYPFTKGLMVVIMIMIVLWFVTSADSAKLGGGYVDGWR